jgi:hypothetical protein
MLRTILGFFIATLIQPFDQLHEGFLGARKGIISFLGGI